MNSATNVDNRDFSATRTRKSSAAASVSVSDAPPKRPPTRRGNTHTHTRDKDKGVSVSSPNNAAGYHADTDSTSGRTAAADPFRCGGGDVLTTKEEERRVELLRRLNQITQKKSKLARESGIPNPTLPHPHIDYEIDALPQDSVPSLSNNNITTSTSFPHADSNSKNGRRRSSRAPLTGTTTSAVDSLVKTPSATSRPARKSSGLRKEDLIMIDVTKRGRKPSTTRAAAKPLPTLVGSGLNTGPSNVKNAQVAYCLRLVKEMMRLKDAFAFSRPIDRLWQRDQLPGYFEMIKQPMDLGTVKARLEQGIYLKPIEDAAHSAALFNQDSFAADMRLVFNNALTYNQPKDTFYEAAKKLLDKFETKFAAMPTKLSEDTPKSNTKSKSRKRKKSGFGTTGTRRRDGESTRRKKQARIKSKTTAAANGSSTPSGSIATIGQESSSASVPTPVARKSMPIKKSSKNKASKDAYKLERHGRPLVQDMTALQLATRIKLLEVRLQNPKSNGSTLYNALAKALYDIELAYEEKLYIGEHVANLPGDKLARLVALASKDMNSSMEVNNNEEVELDFDGLGTKTLRDMQAIVNQTLNAKKGFINLMPNGDVARIHRNELEFEAELLRTALKKKHKERQEAGTSGGKEKAKGGELYESDSSSSDSDSSSSGSDDDGSSDGSSSESDSSDDDDDDNQKGKNKNDEDMRKRNRERNLAHQAAMQKAATPLQSPGHIPVLAKPSIKARLSVHQEHHRHQRWARSPHSHSHRGGARIKATFSEGVNKLEQEGAYAVLDAANALERDTGKSVVHLEIGQPQFDTPEHISQAAIEAINAGKTKYSSPAGIPQLRESIAKRTRSKLDVNVSGNNVVVGPGAKPGMFFATMALVRDRRDEVIIPDPGFPSYAAMVNVAGGTIKRVKLRDGDFASFDMDIFRNTVSENTRLVVLNSPGNPTGGVMPVEDLHEIASLAVRYDFWVISDEIYSDLIYTDDENDNSDEKYISIISMPNMLERTVVVDGFSKSWCMTGWRLGWAVMPEELVERVELLMTHSVGCTATFTQYAGLAALSAAGSDVDGIDEMRRVYKRRRDIVVDALNSIDGVSCALPQGAFYALADIRSFGESSKYIADTLLHEGFVAVLPGTDFGPNGEGYIRISYVSDESVLVDGMSRIKGVLDKMMAKKMALKS